MLDPLYEAIGWLLSIFYSVVPELGIAIILLTFTIMLVLYPLTAKQARSMIRMQMVQPEIKRIQAKYKHDRAKLNEEMMAFYQENKINPLAGCLPLLVQMPIFFALFTVLRNSYKYVPDTSKLYEDLCTRPGTDVLTNVRQCGDAKNLPVHQDFLGIDLSVSAPNQLGTWATFAGFALVVLVMFSGYMQSRQAQKRTPAINKQMALVTKILPVFFGFISLNFPAGLVLYFFVSNLWRLGQQEVIFRRFGTATAPKHRSLTTPLKNGAVDAESREREPAADGDAPEIEATRPTKTTKAQAKRPVRERPAAKQATPPQTAGGAPVVGPTPSGGGLRGLFRLPPPPGETPAAQGGTKASGTSKAAGKAAKAGKAGKPSGKAGAKKASPYPVTARPGQAGRRTSKKKRKR